MKKLIIGGILLLIVLATFIFQTLSSNTIDKKSLKKELTTLESYMVESTLLAHQISISHTTTAYASSQTQDIATKMQDTQQNIQMQTPDPSIKTSYQQTLSLTTHFLHQLNLLSVSSGNTDVAASSEKIFSSITKKADRLQKKL